jgi:hypothetical protein
MKSVIAAMLLWIGANTNYNVDLQHPEIIFLPQDHLEKAYSREKVPQDTDLHAFYDLKNNTIYLSENFNLYSAWDKGVLLHELIHYVQDQNKAKFECLAKMEGEVWPLQKQYLLEMHGVEWVYDPLWFKMISSCHVGL